MCNLIHKIYFDSLQLQFKVLNLKYFTLLKVLKDVPRVFNSLCVSVCILWVKGREGESEREKEMRASESSKEKTLCWCVEVCYVSGKLCERVFFPFVFVWFFFLNIFAILQDSFRFWGEDAAAATTALVSLSQLIS